MMQVAAAPAPPKLAFLDAMRAGLALWVFWGHLAIMCRMHVPILSSPGAAVDGFMMISGFLMVYTTRRTLGQQVTQDAVWRFYLVRFFRIAPLYYFMLLLCWLTVDPWETWRDAWWAAVNNDVTARLEPNVGLASLSAIGAHLVFASGLIPSLVMSVPMPDWSLSLEMQYYLLFPLLCAVRYQRRGPLLALVVTSSLAAYVLPGYLGYYSVPGTWAHFVQPSVIVYKLNVFLVGMMIANWFINGAGQTTEDKVLLMLSVLCLLPCKPIVFVLFALFCYLLKAPGSRLARALSVPFFGKLGDWSYGIYLVHGFVMMPVLYGLDRVLSLSTWVPVARYFPAVLICTALVLAISAAMHKLIEQPGIRLGRQWLAKE